MEVRIGVQSVAKELVIETSMSPAEVEQRLADAQSQDHGLFTLSDDKGGSLVIPADKLAYLELRESESKRVGFGTL